MISRMPHARERIVRFEDPTRRSALEDYAKPREQRHEFAASYEAQEFQERDG
jgi:hypothetical protein